ncbi:MAG: type II toxin-antitoxin system VapC family toxin [Verrucomicrobia bacterium]|nr:type II toxin-antitoxin system VapC family toxin [Verrucomicrobiota bacterium]
MGETALSLDQNSHSQRFAESVSPRSSMDRARGTVGDHEGWKALRAIGASRAREAAPIQDAGHHGATRTSVWQHLLRCGGRSAWPSREPGSYPDASFLCAFYLKQSNSPAAATHAARMKEPLQITEFVKYEFRQSLRFQVWRHAANAREGIALSDALAALSQFEADLTNGVAVLAACSFSDVLPRAEALSKQYTIAGGHRSFDVLHVATALALDASQFFTFDGNQRRLAMAEGLKVKP